jgi:hypothetical protein
VVLDYAGPSTQAELADRLKSSNVYEAQHARRMLDWLAKKENCRRNIRAPFKSFNSAMS